MADVTEVNPGNSGNGEAEYINDSVAFFYEEGKGGENYWSKNKFSRVNRKKDGFVS